MRVRHKIFINYRQTDAGDAAAFIDHALTRTFGPDTVFKASRSVGAGATFPPVIEAGLDEMCVMLVLVGRHWLDTKAPEAERALWRDDDWVRREIGYALALDPEIPVIPVLLGNLRRVPEEKYLPPELRSLTERQTVHFRARHVVADLPGLIAKLHKEAPELAVRHFVRADQEAPAGALPSTLLLPEHGVVPFHGRKKELARLEAWRDAPDPLGVEVIVGAAGQGKTRLALEFCERSRRAGWVAGALSSEVTLNDVVALSESGVSALALIDRAEPATAQVADILSALTGRGPDAAPVRMILISRTAGAWFEEIVERSNDAAAALLLGVRPLELGGLGGALDHDAEFRDAAALFAERLGRPAPPPAAPAPVELMGTDRVLDVHAAALGAVLGPVTRPDDLTAEETDPVIRLLHHERQDWKRGALAAELPDPHRERLAVAVAAATMYGGAREDTAYRVLAVQQTFCQEPMQVIRRYQRWLARLYPPGEQVLGTTAPHALRPDRLGEEHVALTVAEHPELVRGLAEHLDAEHAQRALLVLGRAAPRHPHLVERIAELIEGDLANLPRMALWTAQRLEDPRPLIQALIVMARRCTTMGVAHSMLPLIPPEPEYGELLVITARFLLSAEHTRANPDRLTIAEVSRMLGLAHSVLGEHEAAVRALRMSLEAYGPGFTEAVMDQRRVEVHTLLAHSLGRIGRRAEGREMARKAVERMRPTLATDPLSPIVSRRMRTSQQAEERLLTDALRAYLDLVDDPDAESAALAGLLDRLRRIARLRQQDRLLQWALERLGYISAKDVPVPPDLAPDVLRDTLPARHATKEELHEARRRLAEQITLLLDAPVDATEPTPVDDVVAAARVAGIYRRHGTLTTATEHGEEYPLTVIAIALGEGDLRALYWSPLSGWWILDYLYLDPYGDYERVGNLGMILGPADLAPDAIVAAVTGGMAPPTQGWGSLA
ncbi:TIR domain-containing protein [Spongiactinospora sp. TRM90649]|uniref:TIR domain-containing protein n=1 Tax=Spongiactinospora sp. TRM90649 TaxID=3031114 RepID=UPI0023F66BF9|nr:TIR domain-containing protein [Spongiactinospora sp. TRM90649]MDF5756203.1 TIR domain-containing protein [Spongiactinospora sp. TRM90649]